MLINIDAVKKEAMLEINEERVKKAKQRLIAQLRVIENAEQILRAEKIKLADIEQQISDGTL